MEDTNKSLSLSQRDSLCSAQVTSLPTHLTFSTLTIKAVDAAIKVRGIREEYLEVERLPLGYEVNDADLPMGRYG
jgi:hypothetical protein